MSDKRRSKEDEIEAIKWLRDRPECLHDLMIRFPPSCQVRALRPLHVPGKGKIGQVVAYVEKLSGNGGPGVRVFELPDGDIAAECEPGWLEVVSYYEDVTPDFVRAALAKHVH
jgi:hypothetical protein